MIEGSAGAAITWLCLTACTTVKPNSEKPVFGDQVHHYRGWTEYCQRNPLDTDCKKAK